jgi:hypothetical protein
VRLRGGFSVNGGVMLLPGTSPGPAFGLAGRLGVQINRWFSVMYQNSPIVTLTLKKEAMMGMASGGYKAGFADYNSILAQLSLGRIVDIAAGPSVDFLAVANGSASASISGTPGVSTMQESSSGVSFGLHGRFAINIGSWAIGFDAHPLFTPGGKGLSLTLGLGGEYY